MVASNTRDCFREFIGHRVVGLLFDSLPLNRCDLQTGNTTMVFEDGRGLTIASNGSYWIDSRENVARAIEWKKKALDETASEISEVLTLAGVQAGTE